MFVWAHEELIYFICSQTQSPRLGMLTVETAVIAFVDFHSSNWDRKGQSYLVEYYLESVEGVL